MQHVDVETVLDRLNEAGVAVWLGPGGGLRIDKGAPSALKKLVREHKQAITDVMKAVALMNEKAVRIIHLPLGETALEYQPPMEYQTGKDLDQIRSAMLVLRLDGLPLVVSDEGPGWQTSDEWKLRGPLRYEPEEESEGAEPASGGEQDTRPLPGREPESQGLLLDSLSA